MIPGMGKALKNVQVDEKAMNRMVAIVQSMTVEERRNPNLLNGSRKKRIAAGSGNSIQAVNQLIKQFGAMQKMFGKMGKGQLRNIPKGMAPFLK
jgi:signal recognition particle subunit SRP54